VRSASSRMFLWQSETSFCPGSRMWEQTSEAGPPSREIGEQGLLTENDQSLSDSVKKSSEFEQLGLCSGAYRRSNAPV
jgi:hypothetical protein